MISRIINHSQLATHERCFILIHLDYIQKNKLNIWQYVSKGHNFT